MLHLVWFMAYQFSASKYTSRLSELNFTQINSMNHTSIQPNSVQLDTSSCWVVVGWKQLDPILAKYGKLGKLLLSVIAGGLYRETGALDFLFVK